MIWLVYATIAAAGFGLGVLCLAFACDVLHARIDRLAAHLDALRTYVGTLDECQDAQRLKINHAIERLSRIERPNRDITSVN